VESGARVGPPALLDEYISVVDLAHPFRLICHNGEINTLRGNVNWIARAKGRIASPVLAGDLEKNLAAVYDGQSTRLRFDNGARASWSWAAIRSHTR